MEIVSKKTIEGKEIYRIHHILEDQLAGLEAVERTEDGKFRKVLNWNDGGELEDYMNELEDIVAVSKEEHDEVVDFLENFPLSGKEQLEELLAEQGAKIEYFLSTSYAYYAFVKNEERSEVGGAPYYQAYKVILDRYGDFKTLTGIEEQHDFELLLSHMVTELDNGERAFFQFNPFETCGIKRIDDKVDFLFIRTVEDEENEGQERYISSHQQVHTLIHEPGSSELSIQVDPEKTEEEVGEFIIEMLALISGTEASEIQKN